MRIFLFSDLHYPTRKRVIPDFSVLCDNAELIVACGDFVAEDVLDRLKLLDKPLLAVRGNMDEDDVRRQLPPVIETELEGFNVGITHGMGSPFGVKERIQRLFSGPLSIIFFGHTHEFTWEKKENILYVNPGALCSGDYCIVTLTKEAPPAVERRRWM